MVQLGFYAHMKLALGAPRAGLAPSGPLLFAVAFMLVFSAVIALFKDIPDVKGDRQARPAPLWARIRISGGVNLYRLFLYFASLSAIRCTAVSRA